jgi:hypothetical protein
VVPQPIVIVVCLCRLKVPREEKSKLGRYRNRRSRATSLAAATAEDCGRKVTAMAEAKCRYLEEKMALKRHLADLQVQEHEKRMRILELQERLLVAQLKQHEQ